MFKPEPREATGLQKAIDDLLHQMDDLTGDTPEYAAMADQLTKLMKLQSEVGRQRIKPDTWASVIANLGGILIIVAYEQKHVIVSKALPFIGRRSS